MQTVTCTVYRCGRQDDMYLYLAEGTSPEQLPEALSQRMGALAEVMTLVLSAQRKLARVDVIQVMRRLQEQGYFLQLPPGGAVRVDLYAGD